MDRREMLVGAVAPGFLLTTEQVARALGAFVSPEAEAAFCERLATAPKSYDPVAVLEAMAERDFWFDFELGGDVRWLVAFVPDDKPSSEMLSCGFPDFPSAVRWLHAQAAAVDEGFAERFPLPAE